MSFTSSTKRYAWLVAATAATIGCLPAGKGGEETPAVTPASAEAGGKRPAFRRSPSISAIGDATAVVRPPQGSGGGEEGWEFATGISVYTCDYDPPRLTLPRRHLGTACEMTAVATPYRDDDADVYDVSVPLVWSGDSPWVAIEPFGGSHRNTLVYGRSSIDLFDLGMHVEPETTVRVCAVNDCAGAENGCVPEICREIIAYAVVNLEGSWCMSGASFYDTCSEHVFFQDGRHLTVHDGQGHRIGLGGLSADTVSWEVSDVLYVGTIDPNRDLLYGQAYWLMTDEYAGDWQATRLPGQEH